MQVAAEVAAVTLQQLEEQEEPAEVEPVGRTLSALVAL
jgi:hypothetical protein